MRTSFLQKTVNAIFTVLVLFFAVLSTANTEAEIKPDANPTEASSAVIESSLHGMKPIPLMNTCEQPNDTTDAVIEEPTEQPTYTQPAPTEPVIVYYTEEDVIALAKTLYRECGGVKSKTEQACVAWTVCNRVDDGHWGDTVLEILTHPHAFAYREDTKVTPEMYELAADVLSRWNAERNGETNVGRVLPPDYMYFHGDGEHNWFRNAYNGDYKIWDYSLESPYEN